MKLEHAKINYSVAIAHHNYVTAKYWYKKIKGFSRKHSILSRISPADLTESIRYYN